MAKTALISISEIEHSIYLIRGQRVMLDFDLANLYGVSTKRLNEQVKRNKERFPANFMFQLNYQEVTRLRSQFATLKIAGKGKHRKYLPYVFTEHGALMLANVLRSKTAIRASIQVVEAFIKLREMVASHKEIRQTLEKLDRKVASHDTHIQALFEAIHQLMEPPQKKKKAIGFHSP